MIGDAMRVTVAAALIATAVGGCSSSTRARVPVESVVTTAPPAAVEAPGSATASPSPSVTLTKAGPRRKSATGKRVRVARPSIGRFVAEVKRQMPQFMLDRRDDEVAELGEMACRSIASRKTRTAVVNEITEYGVGAGDARELVTLASGTACRT